jgi:hypothetical protein
MNDRDAEQLLRRLVDFNTLGDRLKRITQAMDALKPLANASSTPITMRIYRQQGPEIYLGGMELTDFDLNALLRPALIAKLDLIRKLMEEL